MTQEFKAIGIEEARKLIEEGAVLLDIRDIQTYQMIRHANALHLTNDSVSHYLTTLEFESPILIVCYHGHSSQNVAQFFAESGFSAVFSVNGGMTAWAQLFPDDCIEGSL
ncbi:thiosulfate sulfurtransferase GlpE [Thorsellia anophelis]|uniref:Thiosulfate sulfurtransferase n=1 Tax=Thorsellia anophelis DSM 18579 TaxID=1123402 RepID=A0A1I0F5H1_9GAMM|nr:thiosulfate sulfurtransferase GlpE [Thorsellia anophelis]SET52668.1 thiosulfate sulfurtransferase [Thorsellia anophelis DSM 18579]